MGDNMRPNVLIIMTDQQFGGALSCAGNDDLSTPAMDSIAATGVRFELAYCAYPICIPSRESMLTGRMPFELGYREWGDAMDPKFERQQLGFLFADAGYRCVYGGKLHAPKNDPALHGFENICRQDDNRLAQSCIDFLEEEHSEPFLMVASFDNPHNICEWARNQNLPWGNVPDVPLDDCPSLPSNFAIPPYEPQIIRTVQSRQPLVYPTVGFTPDDWRHYRNAYYRLVEKVDGEISKILAALQDTGLADNTLILFTSDHGDGHGAHQWNQKSILYEESIRIPLIVSYPPTIRQGIVDNHHLVSNGLDLLPTVCDYASISPPPDLPGRSLRPLLEDSSVSDWREELIVETWPFQGDPGRTLGRMLRTREYKYVVYGWGRHREQLFDLNTDPGEMVNLAVNARYQGVLCEYRQRLRKYCEEKQDEFLKDIPRE